MLPLLLPLFRADFNVCVSGFVHHITLYNIYVNPSSYIQSYTWAVLVCVWRVRLCCIDTTGKMCSGRVRGKIRRSHKNCHQHHLHSIWLVTRTRFTGCQGRAIIELGFGSEQRLLYKTREYNFNIVIITYIFDKFMLNSRKTINTI